MATRKASTGRPAPGARGARRRDAAAVQDDLHVQVPGPARRGDELVQVPVEPSGHHVVQRRDGARGDSGLAEVARPPRRGCAWPCAATGERRTSPAPAPRRPVGSGSPHPAAYAAERQSTTTPRAATAVSGPSSSRSPERRQRTESGKGGAHRQPVRGDPVGGAHGAPQGRDDDQPAVGASPGRGVEGRQPERLVEHAGVDLRGGRRPARSRARVAGHLVGQASRPTPSRAGASGWRLASASGRSTRARVGPSSGNEPGRPGPRACRRRRFGLGLRRRRAGSARGPVLRRVRSARHAARTPAGCA